MAWTASVRTVAVVGAAVDVNVRVRVGPDTISGTMIVPGTAPVPFDGWLGLITAVGRLQAGLADPDRDRERARG